MVLLVFLLLLLVFVPAVDSVADFAGVLFAAGGPTVVFLLFLVVPAVAGVPAVGGVPAVTGVHALSLPFSSCVKGRIPHMWITIWLMD